MKFFKNKTVATLKFSHSRFPWFSGAVNFNKNEIPTLTAIQEKIKSLGLTTGMSISPSANLNIKQLDEPVVDVKTVTDITIDKQVMAEIHDSAKSLLENFSPSDTTYFLFSDGDMIAGDDIDKLIIELRDRVQIKKLYITAFFVGESVSYKKYLTAVRLAGGCLLPWSDNLDNRSDFLLLLSTIAIIEGIPNSKFYFDVD
ncbi:hypothetical protein [Photobacterium leiognathi]|uniref:hypothetical protein n=1 Tax=Photobacterium leiognathi TaxID=553611 RepID=UPI002980A956|nr:hypothetical protein [Photobacterium leiognathi]